MVWKYAADTNTVVDMGGVASGTRRRPVPELRPYVRYLDGYRMSGFDPGTHVGMPSTDVTVIIPLDAALEVARPGGTAESFGSLASGLSITPVTIFHDGSQHGVQLSVTPIGARVLLGAPSAQIGPWIVPLKDLLGRDCAELEERIAGTDDWARRLSIVEEVLLRRSRACAPTSPDHRLTCAWDRLVSGSGVSVQDVADDIGWSRRHLVTRFTAEFGITPKQAARVARFDRSHTLLRLETAPRLVDIALSCGYFDQAHMAREWRELAGSAPSVWRANEQFAFVQDTADRCAEYLPA